MSAIHLTKLLLPQDARSMSARGTVEDVVKVLNFYQDICLNSPMLSIPKELPEFTIRRINMWVFGLWILIYNQDRVLVASSYGRLNGGYMVAALSHTDKFSGYYAMHKLRMNLL